jgi:hypothetical protein
MTNILNGVQKQMFPAILLAHGIVMMQKKNQHPINRNGE